MNSGIAAMVKGNALIPSTVASIFLTAPATAVDDHYHDISQPPVKLLHSGKTVLGQPLQYPEKGEPLVTSMILTIEPGEETATHKHGVPMFVYMLSGELEVEYAHRGIRRFAAGDAFMEATGIWHTGRNSSQQPARVLIVFLGSDEAENVIRQAPGRGDTALNPDND